MEEELTVEEVSEKLTDTDGEHFFELFKKYNQRFFTYGHFNEVYYYEQSFSSMFLFLLMLFTNDTSPDAIMRWHRRLQSYLPC